MASSAANTIDLNDFTAGGYLITKYARREPDRSPDLLPERLVSLSGCICPVLKMYWGWHLDRDRQEALDFGIPEDKLPVLQTWGSDESDSGYPGIFYTLEAARHWASVLGLTDVLLLGVALRNELVDEFLAINKLTISDYIDGQFVNERELPPEQWHDVHRVLYQHKSLIVGGEILGFEVLSYFHGFGHSWLCSILERDMHQQFGIRPNAHGLIDTYDDAKKVYDWIAEDECKGTRAEPEPYYPWLLVNYPLTG